MWPRPQGHLPLSEPGSSSVSARVSGNPSRWPSPDPGSAAACCLWRCRSPSVPRRRCSTDQTVWRSVPCLRRWLNIEHCLAMHLPAVDEHGSHLLRARSGRRPDEGQDGQSVLRHAHVRPLRVVEVENRVFFPLRSLQQRYQLASGHQLDQQPTACANPTLFAMSLTVKVRSV